MAARTGVSAKIPIFNYSDFTNKVSLGKGEFGEVYGAKHPLVSQTTIRIISRNFHARQEDINALKEEASILFSVISDHVLRLVGMVLEPLHLCLIFEYAEYGSLNKVLQRCEIPWPLKIKISFDIALGMMYLHSKNILHLRLKCSSILMTDGMLVKISDVFIGDPGRMRTWTTYAQAHQQSCAGTITCSTVSGSNLAHVAPELIRDVNTVPNEVHDVYAYSIILWQIITNQAPYQGEPDDVVFEAVSGGGRPSLQKIPDDRPDILFDVMSDCWKEHGRPSFEEVKKRIEPQVTENYDNAKNMALECQKVLNDFNKRNNIYITAPESDVKPPVKIADGVIPPPTASDGTPSRFISKSSIQPPVQRQVEVQSAVLLQSEVIPKKAVCQRQVAVMKDEGNIENRAKPPNDTVPVEEKPVVQHQENAARGNANSPTTAQLYAVANELGAGNWRLFGHSLKFTDCELDNITANYKAEGYPEIPYQMLRKWVEKDPVATVENLAQLLAKNNFRKIAKKLNQ